jgi:hypothetical protein
LLLSKEALVGQPVSDFIIGSFFMTLSFTGSWLVSPLLALLLILAPPEFYDNYFCLTELSRPTTAALPRLATLTDSLATLPFDLLKIPAPLDGALPAPLPSCSFYILVKVVF